MITEAFIFVDTNVLVYVRDSGHPRKQRQAAEWMSHLWESRRGRLSVQVLNEYYVTVTRKIAHPMDAADARDDVLSLVAWKPVPVDLTLVERAWTLADRHPLSHWDALIIAAAERAGCRTVLSEDLAHGVDLDGVRVVNPFEEAPPA